MRLIDADALASLMEKHLEDFKTMVSEHGKGLAHGTRLAIERIAEQPTIDPESLRSRGHWVKQCCDIWVCANCVEEIYWNALDNDELPKYCPNCGARMKERSWN